MWVGAFVNSLGGIKIKSNRLSNLDVFIIFEQKFVGDKLCCLSFQHFNMSPRHIMHPVPRVVTEKELIDISKVCVLQPTGFLFRSAEALTEEQGWLLVICVWISLPRLRSCGSQVFTAA